MSPLAQVTVGADSGVAASNIKSVTLVGTGGVKLTGDITTSSTAGGGVSITGPVTLKANVIIDADAANTTVTFNSTATVNSDSTERDLDIRTDTGKITMDATIGNSAAIGILSINSAELQLEILSSLDLLMLLPQRLLVIAVQV